MKLELKYKILRMGNFVVSDKVFSHLAFYYLHFRMGFIPRWLNIKTPRTFNEKIIWNKLNNHFDGGDLLADKYHVRDFIKKTVGDKYLIPLLGVYKDAKEINFDILPQQFIIKMTQSSGLNMIVKDKSALDIESIQKSLNKWLKIDYSIFGREWQYNVHNNKIIIEKLMADDSLGDLKDYKYFCFNGVPKFIQVNSEKLSGNQKRDFYDLSWGKQNFSISLQPSQKVVDKPVNLQEMNDVAMALSTALSDKLNFARIDLYNIDGQIFFGEITFHPQGGCSPFSSYEYDLKLGEMIELKTNITK